MRAITFMTINLMGLAFCAAATAQPAPPSATSSSSASPGVESATVTGSRISCIRQEATTGSRIGGRKICHTEAQWQQLRANSQLDVGYLQDRSNNAYEGAALAGGGH